MLREMMRPKLQGQTLTISLSEWGYPNYIAECTYRFDPNRKKYSLTIWLNRSDLDDRMRLSSKKVDTQYISASEDTIVEYVCRIVHQAATAGHNGKTYFAPYVRRYEYELQCFERGNELFEQERLSIHTKGGPTVA